MSELTSHRAKRFFIGKALLILSVLPWLAWVCYLGRNDPSADPVLHHHWLMRNFAAFALGIFLSLGALIFLSFGIGWRRIVYIIAAFCLLFFYTGTLLVGD